ncbi:MAG: SapC family protein [Halioglobus sp.]
MANPVPLDPSLHSGLRVRNAPDLDIARGQQVLPVTVHEFAVIALDCPVVFIKNDETGQFQSVALLGLSQGENLMLQGDKWLGNFFPGALRMSPFKLLIANPESDTVTVAIDTDSSLVNETEGERLFSETGEITEFMSKRRDALQDYVQQGHVTQAFMKLLADRDLLKQQSLTLDINGVKVQVDGIYLVDEKKLREVDDQTILDLNQRGFLPAIYAHLMSLRQATRLARIKVEGASDGPSIRGA